MSAGRHVLVRVSMLGDGPPRIAAMPNMIWQCGVEEAARDAHRRVQSRPETLLRRYCEWRPRDGDAARRDAM
jgi:hypothetical protein